MGRFLIILFLFGSKCVLGQQIVFQNYDESDGLPDNTITCIDQSDDNFLWIGTTNGLCRFDGLNFKIYQSGPSKFDLTFSHIQDIEFEDERLLWVATRKGLNRLDMQMDTFMHFSQEKTPTLPSPIGHDLFKDLSGRIWYTSDFRDPAVWLPEEKIFKTLSWKAWVKKNNISSKVYLNVNRLIQKSGSDFWMCTNVGLFSVDPEKNQFEHYPVPPGKFHEFTDGYDDKNGRLWLNTGGLGIQVFNYQDNEWELPFRNAAPNSNTDLYTQWGIINAGNGRLYAGLSDGLGTWSLENEHLYIEKSDPLIPWSVLPGAVLSLFKDVEGITWIGTVNGLSKIDPSKQAFAIRPIKWENQEVTFVCENPETSNRYLSFSGKAPLAVEHLASGDIKYIYPPGGGLFNKLQEMVFDRNGNLWLMEQNRLSMLDFSTSNIEIMPIPDTFPEGGKNVQFNDMAYDGDETLYFGSNKGGLIKFDISSQSFELIHVQDKNIESQIQGLFWDVRDSKLWFGSRNGWLGEYHPETKNLSSYAHDPGNPGSLASQMVLGGARLSDSTICFITEPGGISILNTVSGSNLFQNYTTRDGLPVNFFRRITADRSGHAWLFFEKGLCRFDPASKRINVFGKDYGLEFTTSSTRFSHSKTGEIFMGSKNGYLSFNPPDLEPDSREVDPVFTSVKVFEEEFLPQLSENGFSFSVPHDQNLLTISYAVLKFSGAENNLVSYRLLGTAEPWQIGPGSKAVTYSNLPPAKYQFQMVADQVTAPGEDRFTTLTFIIRPHFSQTSWFRGLVILIISVVLIGLYKMRINQILKVQRIRNKIAADLHDDVASTISSISFYSEYAEENTPETNLKVLSTLRKINASARASIEIMKEIVWAVQTDKDSYIHLRQRMKDFALPACEAKNIELIWSENNIQGNWPLTLVFRRNIYLIFKEAVNNALKYADCSRIEVNIFRKGKKFKLTISDNGKGADFSEDHQGNGMRNMKLRANEIKGNLKINSIPSGGVSIEFETDEAP